jgi:hypothetical protein
MFFRQPECNKYDQGILEEVIIECSKKLREKKREKPPDF